MSGSHAKHAAVSASKVETWFNCTAALGYAKRNPDVANYSSSIYAEAGTQAHDYAESLLNGKITGADIPESERFGDKDFEMREPVLRYVKQVRSHMSVFEPTNVQPTELVEEGVDLWYAPDDADGVVDHAWLHPEQIIVEDLKHGMSVVKSQENRQIFIYTYSLIKKWQWVYGWTDETKVKMGIVQPRIKTETRYWDTTLGEMHDMAADIELAYEVVRADLDLFEAEPSGDQAAIEAAQAKLEACVRKLELAPSPKACQWCPMKLACSARNAPALDALDAAKAALVPSEAKKKKFTSGLLTEETRRDILKNWKIIEGLYKDIYKREVGLFDRGEPSLLKKVEGTRKGNRRWDDPEKAERFLAARKIPVADRRKTTLISPTVAKELLDELELPKSLQTRFDKLIVRDDPKDIYVLHDDERNPSGLDALPETS